MLLTTLALALGSERVDWLAKVDAEVDASLDVLKTCVVYTYAVSASTADVVALRADWKNGKPRVTRLWQTMKDEAIATCMAKELGKRSLPAPPAGEGALLVLNVDNLQPSRAAKAVFIPVDPAGADQSALPRAYLAGEVTRARLGWGKTCLDPVVKQGGNDVAAKVRVRLEVQADGKLAVTTRSNSGSPEVEACIVEQVRALRVPAGFANTTPMNLAVRLTGSGGEYATEYKRWEETWKWHVLTSLSLADQPSKLDPADPVHVLVNAELALASQAAEFAGCMMKDAVAPRTKFDVTLDVAAGGAWSATVLPSGSTASCLETAVAATPHLSATSPAKYRLTIESLPDQDVLLTPPTADGLAVDWGARAAGQDYRSVLVSPGSISLLNPTLRAVRLAVGACSVARYAIPGRGDEVLLDARFEGATGAPLGARALLYESSEKVAACAAEAASKTALASPFGEGTARVILVSTVAPEE